MPQLVHVGKQSAEAFEKFTGGASITELARLGIGSTGPVTQERQDGCRAILHGVSSWGYKGGARFYELNLGS